MPFQKMENISNFLEACKAYGVAEISCFQTVDLYENKQCYKVIECLRSLAAVYGTNKCASQKGMTPYGLARQIKPDPSG
ncbi:calponin family repeat-containing domain protein [Ancylostoma duodenale]|uniref:Calponin family repeat-containing domain protein n=1 Tax=Ancylostoma duodenale TaxID=51022 RepID=A0A0C2FTB5_9BILA|nr:calponin family repeat-containing domain protein [Ancylostoma duodenale]